MIELAVFPRTRGVPIEVMPMGTPQRGWDGAFGHLLVRLLVSLTAGKKTLHLFSGSSQIGDVRVDRIHPNATHRMDVSEFLDTNDATWDVVLLDPPYDTHSRNYRRNETPLSLDVPLRQTFTRWAVNHAIRVIWLDHCAPIFAPFVREKLYLILPGGYRSVRVLSILKNRSLE